ncbi:MAG: diguanylate cyclase [Oscillospiraceae bacterium]
MKNKKSSFGRRNLILALMLLVIANAVMGLVLLHQSKTAVQTQIEQRMLDIANTAADMLNGDALETLSKDDENTPEYQEGLKMLSYFRDNIELEYIYAINPMPDGTFTFSIDPTTVDPGEFGSPIVTTSALQTASTGVSAVDKTPYEDEWGTFYSAYAPVLDSKGNVAVIVAVDFDAHWFHNQLSHQTLTIAIVTVISLLFGIALAMTISRRIARSYSELNQEMSELNEDFKELDKLITLSSIQKLDLISGKQQRSTLQLLASGETYGTKGEEDQIADIGSGLQSMQESLRHYISYVNSQTYIDEMTGVGNKIAYQKAIKIINERIQNDAANFAVGFFDINDLKPVNVQYGFEQGDDLMFATARILKSVFQQKNVYRVASDEFIVIMEEITEIGMKDLFKKMDEEIQKYNDEKGKPPVLTIAKGMSIYQKDMESYRTVFIEAEANMRKDKEIFHRMHG